MEKNLKIESIKSREILDSRGSWTVEAEVITNFGVFSAGVPSGASKGKDEAKTREAKVAVKNINNIISPKLTGKDPREQNKIDEFLIKLDGTKNKSKLGGNAICGVSMAVCRAGAAAENLPLYKHISKLFFSSPKNQLFLPKPSFNVINGGAHAGNELDVQEFMVVPQTKTAEQSLRVAADIYQELKKIIRQKYSSLATSLGDEGGFAPPILLSEEAIELIMEAAKKLGYQNKVKIILDVAASQFYAGRNYKMKIGNFNSKSLLDYYSGLVKKYPIEALEDPFAENDWQGFREITKKLGKQVIIIGDDFLVTNPEKIKKAKDFCNGLLLKVNQVGTVTEALEAAKIAKSYGWKIMVSHRSGETCDDFIADLAVGIGADYIKAGAPARGERVAKYNRLVKIEKEIMK